MDAITSVDMAEKRHLQPQRGTVSGYYTFHHPENGCYASSVGASAISAQAVRRELERILSSRGFARNERLSRFLRVVVERHLEGRDGDLKESVIGIDIF